MSLSIVRSNVRIPDVGNRWDRPLRAKDDPALIGKGRAEPVAKHLHGNETVGTNAPHHAAEFVHVRVEHDARTGSALLGNDGAEAVVGDFVGEGAHALGHNFADGLLIARGAWRLGKFLEQLYQRI